MNKREFITAAALGSVVLPTLAATQKPASGARRPALLTVTGAIGNHNRGPFDPVLDQLMKKHNVKFDKAHTFDFDAIAAMPSITIKPTLEYDGKPHALSGPLLADVIRATGALANDKVKLLLRAIDGYAVLMPLAEVRRLRFIVAARLDGSPIPLGGLGPLWAIHDADRIPDIAAKPLAERFANCPWGMYHIEVQQG
ncbi:MAG: molybdopterin-dependent oxidoreductase [Pseudomonadota bacterium]